MFHVTKMADYAVMLLCEFASSNAVRLSARDVAARCGLGEPTVKKLLKLLAKADVLDSLRGSGGGYILHRPSEQISLYDVIAAIEGPLAVTDCLQRDHNTCTYKVRCRSQFGWKNVNDHINDYLHSVSIHDFIAMCPVDGDDGASSAR